VELTATLLLRPIGTETLATRFWSYSTGLFYETAAPNAADAGFGFDAEKVTWVSLAVRSWPTLRPHAGH
jgi:hypothetical protein